MRRAGRIDENQPGIVRGLQAVGASVQSLASVGGGVLDLLVGYRRQNFVLEVKDGSKPPSRRKLTPAQQAWLARWRGQAQVVETLEQALAAIGVTAWEGKR